MSKQLRIGQIVGTHGLKGAVKVYPLTDYIERFEELDYVFVEETNEKLIITGVKYKPNIVILQLENYDDINKVEKFRNSYLMIEERQRRKLPEDIHYITDIIGLSVYTLDNTYVGKIENIIQSGSNEVYVIKDDKKRETLIPSVKEFVVEINLEEQKIIVSPIEGMIEWL
ncbi:MAG: ribosome maturation factor RimM [Clostridiales bacterium]|nr:ribosome maturation factor RimM [Clostridiales bacterium]